MYWPPMAKLRKPGEFDVGAFFLALDRQRADRALTWGAAAREIWHLSAGLNERRDDYPIAASTIANVARRGDTSCQHALFMLRWLGRAPEDFVADRAPGTRNVPLPAADEDHRLRWNLRRLYAVLDAARVRREATWRQAAEHLSCTPSQLTGLKTAKFATGMRLAMRICQSLGRPAAEFVYVATW